MVSITFAPRRSSGHFSALSLLCAFSFVLFFFSCAARAGAANEAGNEAVDLSGLPAYDYPYANNLYATLSGYLSIRDIKLDEEKSYKLKIDTFRKKVPVRAIIQRNEAPLAVVLLGLDGRADTDFGRLWPSILDKAGYHVLTFDSTFTPAFIDISGHGVTGYIPAEAERIAKIIDAFTKMPEVRGKISKIGIVGMSYGGLQALLLGKLASEGKLPFEISAIQVYSPPLDIQYTGRLIDKWFEEDRWKYTLVDLATKLQDHKPGKGETPPFSDEMMRAGIAAAFRLGLTDIVYRNDETYKLKLLGGGNTFDDQYMRKDYAETWGYERFMQDMVFPYWSRKLKIDDVSELTAPLAVKFLLQKQPAYTQLIIAEDDPFNRPEDVFALQQNVGSHAVTFLPRGGHLGYVNTNWVHAKLKNLFSKEDRKDAASRE